MMLDNSLALFFAASRTASGTTFFRLVTTLGSEIFIALLVVATLVFLWKKGLHRYMVPLVVGMVGSTASMFVIKYIVARPRPLGAAIIETGYSFPSGHATASVMLYGFLLFVILREGKHTRLVMLMQALIPLLIILIGLSRLYLGVHYVSDVIGGYALGGLWLYFCTRRFSQHTSTVDIP